MFPAGLNNLSFASKPLRIQADIQKKYDEYGIADKPYIVMKACQDIYGAGDFIVNFAEEIRSLNCKERTKMPPSKEGVPTLEAVGKEKLTTEPVFYINDHYLVGGFYQMHSKSQTPVFSTHPVCLFNH